MLLVGIQQNEIGVVFDLVIPGGIDQLPAKQYCFIQLPLVLQHVYQMIQNDLIVGEAPQPLPQNFLCLGWGFLPQRERLPTQILDLLICVVQVEIQQIVNGDGKNRAMIGSMVMSGMVEPFSYFETA